MGQQQLLLIVLGVIIVGVAIWVGVAMFSAYSVSSNKQAIILDLQSLEQDIIAYSRKPRVMGGGGGNMTGYAISSSGPWGASNGDAGYSIVQQPREILLRGDSKVVNGAFVLFIIDNTGKVLFGPLSNGFAR